MACCPNCKSPLSAQAESCDSCGALFTGDGWRPISDANEQADGSSGSSSGASIVLATGIASVLVPAAGFCVGLLLRALIPGCRCDEGAGCAGCGVNALLELLLFGGVSAGLVALVTVLPASLLLAGVIGLMSSRRS